MKHNWEYKKLGEVCETTSGGTPSKIKLEYYTNGNIPWLRSGEIRQGLIFDTDIYITEEGLKHSSAKIIPINSVVIAMYGATVGQCGIIKSKMCTNQAVCSIFPNSNIIPEFLCLFLTSKKNTFIKSAVGGAQPNISQNIVRNTLIPLPPLSVQERIVEELDRLSLILEKKKQQIKELDSLAQSIFYDMFGDPIENEKGWEMKPISEIARFYNGKAHEQAIDEKGEYVLVNSKFISSNGMIKKRTNLQLCPLFINDITMVMSDVPNGKALAKCYLIDKDNIYTLNQRICVFRDYQILPQYLLFALNRNKYFLNFNDGNGQTNLRKNEVEKCPIQMPPLDLQQSFAKKIEAIEKQKELINQSIKEVQLLFDAKMDYYFGD